MTVPPALDAARRWQLLHTATSGKHDRSAPAPRSIPGDLLVTAGGFGLVQVASLPGFTATVTILAPANAPTDSVATLVEPEDIAAVGPNLEPKYRICSVAQPADDTLQISVAETTWQEGASFHRAMRRLAPLPPQLHDHLLRALVEETGQLPGITGVHCVIRTQDHTVVAAQRSSRTSYSAGRWSVSFEEQLTDIDFTSDREDPFSAAARRGYTEEFGLPADNIDIHLVAAIVETEIFNRVLVAVIETDETAAALEHAARHATGAAFAEIEAVRVIAGSPDALRVESQRCDLHPTAALRLHLLAKLLDGGHSAS